MGRSRMPVRDTIQSSLTPSRSASSALVTGPSGSSVADRQIAGRAAPTVAGELAFGVGGGELSRAYQALTSSTSFERALDRVRSARVPGRPRRIARRRARAARASSRASAPAWSAPRPAAAAMSSNGAAVTAESTGTRGSRISTARPPLELGDAHAPSSASETLRSRQLASPAGRAPWRLHGRRAPRRWRPRGRPAGASCRWRRSARGPRRARRHGRRRRGPSSAIMPPSPCLA